MYVCMCVYTGAAAVAADNLFYYLTYENAVNIDSIEDPLQREAAKAQVECHTYIHL